mgnify:CR=1 FL=1
MSVQATQKISNTQLSEITSFDLLVRLVNQKKIFSLVFILIIGLGIVHTYFIKKTQNYENKTVIKIGTISNKSTLIQPIESIKSKLVLAYVREALQEFYNVNKFVTSIAVDNPKNTSLITLQSIGPIQDSDLHLSIQRAIVTKLKAEHDIISQAILDELQLEKVNLK